MAADANLIKKADLDRVREKEFVFLFEENIKKLMELIGVTRQIPKQAGAILKAYKATGTLEDGSVAEGDDIPLSKYAVEAVNFGEITLKKWAKKTSAEAIADRGYDQAVTMTTDKMLQQIQNGIKSNFITLLGTAGTTTSGASFQSAIANAWGKLNILFEDNSIDAVYFVNPMDWAAYMGSATISTQTQNGITYISDFMGLGTIIFNSSVTQGTIYATAKENIVLYYIPVNGADLQYAFDFISDATGLIGIHEHADYGNMTAVDTVVSGVLLFAEKLTGIVKSTIGV